MAWGYYNTPESRERIEVVMGLTSGTLKHTTWVLTDAQFIDSLNKIVVRQDASTNQMLLTQLADGMIARQDVMDRFVESNRLYKSFTKALRLLQSTRLKL
ncbi:MAG: hypothetical protein ACI8WB_006202 [Phenylobacterium sp.]